MTEPEDLPASLEAAAQRHLARQVTVQKATRLSAGASADTFLIEVDGASEPGWVLRRSTRNMELAVDKRTEALTQRACRDAGIPVPEVVFVLEPEDGLGDGYVTALLQGETLPQRILSDPKLERTRATLAARCGQVLAAIHQVPLESLPHLADEDVHAQIEALQAQHRSFAEPQPVFELALRWLREHVPSRARRSLVHGDFRNGNIMIDADGIVAVLDWELTHLGDPLEDLGWLCVNSWRFGQRELPVGGFGTREDLVLAYERAANVVVDRASMHFWEVFGTLKWGVICQYQVFAHLSGEVQSLERAMIGRRVSETAADLLVLLTGEEGWPTATHESPARETAFDRPSAHEILAALEGFATEALLPATSGALQFQARVARNALRTLAREATLGPAIIEAARTRLQALVGTSGPLASQERELASGIAEGTYTLETPGLVGHLRQVAVDRLSVDNPRYSTFRALQR